MNLTVSSAIAGVESAAAVIATAAAKFKRRNKANMSGLLILFL
jgi:hypothetical protein